MNLHPLASRRFVGLMSLISLVLLGVVVAAAVVANSRGPDVPRRDHRPRVAYQKKLPLDAGGFTAVLPMLETWPPSASLEEISHSFQRAGYRVIERLDQDMAREKRSDEQKVMPLLMKAALFNYEGEPRRAAESLDQTRSWIEDRSALDPLWRYSIIYFQGVTALRRGENDNCIDCRGESSCIFPIAPAAIHTNPQGSRLAIRYFTEYLERFPDDLEVRWLLNLAHMTLGEYPDKVPSPYRIALDRFVRSEFDIGRFRDVGHLVGIDRINQAGGAVMDDFDGDDRLDLAVTSTDPTQAMAIYHNRGDGTFEDRSESAGVLGQLGGLVCYQTDYNNDGRLDLFIPAGPGTRIPMRPSLLRNDGGNRFTDVTAEAGLLHAVNSLTASWADYDNDGWLDLFIGCERQPNRLYHNRGNGTFEEVAARAGVDEKDRTFCKGSTWIDFDNDRFPDLFLDYFSGDACLFRNNRDGTFSNVTGSMGIDGPA